MSTEAHKAIIRRFVEEVQNGDNLVAVDELATPGYVNHSAPPGVPPSRDRLKQLASMFRQVFRKDGRNRTHGHRSAGGRQDRRELARG